MVWAALAVSSPSPVCLSVPQIHTVGCFPVDRRLVCLGSLGHPSQEGLGVLLRGGSLGESRGLPALLSMLGVHMVRGPVKPC